MATKEVKQLASKLQKELSVYPSLAPLKPTQWKETAEYILTTMVEDMENEEYEDLEDAVTVLNEWLGCCFEDLTNEGITTPDPTDEELEESDEAIKAILRPIFKGLE